MKAVGDFTKGHRGKRQLRQPSFQWWCFECTVMSPGGGCLFRTSVGWASRRTCRWWFEQTGVVTQKVGESVSYATYIQNKQW